MSAAKYSFIILVILVFESCSDDSPSVDNCPIGYDLLTEFVNEEQRTVRIYSDGMAYYSSDDGCEVVAEYYDPLFFTETFNDTDSGIYFIIDESTFLKTVRHASLDFEGITDALDLFRTELNQTERFLTSFTLQSPSAPTVNDYIALQNCIINGTCDFIDNSFELALDPENTNNTVMKFIAVPPASGMITAKTSVITTLAYFEKGDDFWFEASYYISENLPTTLADFESSYFLESPGPRIIFRGDQLAIENKFNEKLTFNQPESTAVSFPLNQWIKVKVHLKYDESNGVIQLWQDDVLIIDEHGPNMPFGIWIQNRVEMGITATQNQSTLLLDDVRFSDQPL